jgi:hypothetical protein
MGQLTQKTPIYDSMNVVFLRELAENINLSFRSHSCSDKASLVRLLDKKISADKTETVLKMYLTCCDAKDIAQAIKPKGMDEIAAKVKRLFNTPECLYEVTVGSNRCDLVFLVEEEIVAMEIKSGQDSMKNALSQLKSYAQWANRVFLAYDIKHKPIVDQSGLSEKGIGLIEFNRGTVNIKKQAVSEEKNIETVLSLVTYDRLVKLARTNNIRSTGSKQEIALELKQHLSKKQLLEFFNNYLKSRALR